MSAAIESSLPNYAAQSSTHSASTLSHSETVTKTHEVIQKTGYFDAGIVPHIILSYLFSSTVTVKFMENLSTKDLVIAINKLQNARVITWYIGAHGFRADGCSYYRKNIFKPLNTPNSNSQLYLYDLTAWNAFTERTKSVADSNPNVSVINQFNLKKFRALKSSDYFQWLSSIKLDPLGLYFKHLVFNGSFLFKASEDYKPSSITIGEVLNNRCPVMVDHYQRDAAKSYSAFQYIEGAYLLSTLVAENCNDNQREVNIVFALPNNESRYYKNDENSFPRDVTEVLNHRLGLVGYKVNVFFYSFNFGNKPHNRPYNAGTKNIDVLTKDKLI